MKNSVYFIICAFFLFLSAATSAQNINGVISDTVNQQKIQNSVLPDTGKQNSMAKNNQQTGTDTLIKISDRPPITASSQTNHSEGFIIQQLLSKNKFINIKDQPVSFIENPHTPLGKEFLFYTLFVVLLILAIFKTIFTGYFKNLFRVYFNTSLRQTQLADQLEQAKLPSFIMNIFFTITTGIYIWLLFNYYHPPRLISTRLLLPFCILSVATLYFIKFCLLKFLGWVTNIQETTNNYIFAIFLVNKIIGIVLVPVIILLAFLNPKWLPVITNISIMLFGLLFISRYIKSYGAIDRKFPLNPFHFIIYLLGAEIIPLLLIYKSAIDYVI
ncbi:MAG: DUF4271 domain-containing protein [Ginsengibacter sp.]